MPHPQPVPDIPLWDRFTAECRRVIREFGLDPDDRRLFELSRSGEDQCSIVKAGTTHGYHAEFGIQLTAAHRAGDDRFRYDAPAELQFNGWTSPLAIALQMALYPLVFDPVPRREGTAVVDAAYAFGLRR